MKKREEIRKIILILITLIFIVKAEAYGAHSKYYSEIKWNKERSRCQKKWKEYPKYPKKIFVFCNIFETSPRWYDTKCIYYRKDKKKVLFTKNIITAFSNPEGVNADGTFFNPTNFLEGEHNYQCKKYPNYFDYVCRQ